MKHYYTRKERILILALATILVWSSYSLYARFIKENSTTIPTIGGIYTEGLVGKPLLLNPLFSGVNPVDRDISTLIFSGLTKFNSQTGQIEDNLATSQRSKNNLTYTFTLLPDIKWHDAHPVTSEDIIFTYQTVIQSDAFQNHFLHETFKNIKITKIDNRTVTFSLKEPYSFFLSNVTTGLLPKHLLEVFPPEELNNSEFNQAPVGIGPYTFKSWIQNGDIAEITLKRNENYFGSLPKIETLIFRIFPTKENLLLAQNTLNGYKIATADANKVNENDRFKIHAYQLPQYVALFLNTEAPFLQNKKTRFGLLLATDKEAIAQELQNVSIADTPVLESKTGLDIEYNESRAKGAFYDTEWFLPKKLKDKEEVVDKDTDSSESTVSSKTLNEAKENLLPTKDPLIFTITAESESWITPKADDDTKEGFLLKEGETKIYEVQEEFTFVSLGNAGGVQIFVNDIELKPLGENGAVIRNFSITKENIFNYLTEENQEKFQKTISNKEEASKKVEKPEEEKEETINTPLEKELENIRINSKGERLILKLITAQNPPEYLKTAEIIQNQWKKAGVKVVVDTYPPIDLQRKIQERDYDILLFGQNLGYNLDAYPFWHSSQAEKGFNVSQHKSIATDSLLVEIRETFNESKKQQALDQLKKNIAENTPAIFLYNPLQYAAIDAKVKNINLRKLATDADRVSDIPNWYIKEDFKLKHTFSISTFFSWIIGNTSSNTTD